LERKHPANERFGGESELFVDQAEAVGLKKDTAPVWSLAKLLPGARVSEGNRGFDALELRPLVPSLRLEASQIVVGKRDDATAAADAALVTIPSLDRGQDVNGKGHGSHSCGSRRRLFSSGLQIGIVQGVEE
jgi:hypothetical protein